MATKKKRSFFDYVKTAFVNHWNLLLLGAGVAAGAISGHADVAIPLLAAGEIAYLAGMASNRKFQKYVDAEEYREAREEAAETQTEPALRKVYRALDPRSRARFEELRRRCRDLRSLSRGVGGVDADVAKVDDMQQESVNKLLWAFLKLLYSKRSLEVFLARTDEREIRASIETIEAKIAALGPESNDSPMDAKRRASLADTLASATLRLDNLARARENLEFIELEADRIDHKITSIAELSVNRQDPDFITAEVDGVAASMAETEKAMSELQFISGLSAEAAPPPSFMDEDFDVA